PPPHSALKISGREEWTETYPVKLYDVAHEALSLNAVADVIEQAKANYREIWILFACLQDKQIFSVLPRFFQLATHLLFSRLEHPRSWNPEIVFEHFPSWKTSPKVEIKSNVASAVQRCQESSDRSDLIVITGSFGILQESKRWWSDS
ncbi:MAG: hypothetical protein AABZ60_14995, partial [Planctomycetota bacterium]